MAARLVLLGSVLFSLLYAAAASLVSRQAALRSVPTPLTFVVLLPFFVTVYALPALGPDDPRLAVLGQVPLSSPS